MLQISRNYTKIYHCPYVDVNTVCLQDVQKHLKYYIILLYIWINSDLWISDNRGGGGGGGVSSYSKSR